MSHRSIRKKQAARLRKALNRKPLPAYFDLVQYLIDKRYATTRKQARELITSKQVSVDGTPVGIQEQRVPNKEGRLRLSIGLALKDEHYETIDAVVPHLPVENRGKVVVGD